MKGDILIWIWIIFLKRKASITCSF
jgi:hypothetical protein